MGAKVQMGHQHDHLLKGRRVAKLQPQPSPPRIKASGDPLNGHGLLGVGPRHLKSQFRTWRQVRRARNDAVLSAQLGQGHVQQTVERIEL
jgi:hypothetical protein